MVNHDCRECFEEKTATLKNPYCFSDCGLPNVLLVGIKYRVCKICGKKAADIPSVKNLMVALARAVVQGDAPLTGPEIRFLRKRLGYQSAELAGLAGVTPEQVSRWEHDRNRPEKSADKLIRMAYCQLSGDRELKEKFEKHIAVWLPAWARDGQLSEIRAKIRNREWETELVLA